ncbi:hypothetical protein [Streptomyces albicerus]|uniref:hypothetical protein n=1 Tax=Streptomyces albicerus TaxID=2569859 RepID=UPI00124B7C9A|nr:hypothetical protein [Streptomyces albicerus]
MPRTQIPVTQLSDAGVADPAETTADVANGNQVANTGKTVLRIRNAHATLPQNVTFVTPITVGGKAVSDTVVSIPATATRTFGSLPTSLYGTQMPIDGATTDIKFIVFEP